VGGQEVEHEGGVDGGVAVIRRDAFAVPAQIERLRALQIATLSEDAPAILVDGPGEAQRLRVAGFGEWVGLVEDRDRPLEAILRAQVRVLVRAERVLLGEAKALARPELGGLGMPARPGQQSPRVAEVACRLKPRGQVRQLAEGDLGPAEDLAGLEHVGILLAIPRATDPANSFGSALRHWRQTLSADLRGWPRS
jgi:hypothetical protein